MPQQLTTLRSTVAALIAASGYLGLSQQVREGAEHPLSALERMASSALTPAKAKARLVEAMEMVKAHVAVRGERFDEAMEPRTVEVEGMTYKVKHLKGHTQIEGTDPKGRPMRYGVNPHGVSYRGSIPYPDVDKRWTYQAVPIGMGTPHDQAGMRAALNIHKARGLGESVDEAMDIPPVDKWQTEHVFNAGHGTYHVEQTRTGGAAYRVGYTKRTKQWGPTWRIGPERGVSLAAAHAIVKQHHAHTAEPVGESADNVNEANTPHEIEAAHTGKNWPNPLYTFVATPRHHTGPSGGNGWRSVVHKGRRYQLHGGIHGNEFINLAHPIPTGLEKSLKSQQNDWNTNHPNFYQRRREWAKDRPSDYTESRNESADNVNADLPPSQFTADAVAASRGRFNTDAALTKALTSVQDQGRPQYPVVNCPCGMVLPGTPGEYPKRCPRCQTPLQVAVSLASALAGVSDPDAGEPPEWDDAHNWRGGGMDATPGEVPPGVLAGRQYAANWPADEPLGTGGR